MIQVTYNNTMQKRDENGFSLIELSVVLVVIGLLMGASASLVQPYVDSYRYDSTKIKMERIADALAMYVQTHYSVPCPASVNPGTEPFGTPMGSGTDGANLDAKCPTSGTSLERGIIPFNTLGLTEDQVKDAYGNYITYVVPAVWNRYKNNPDRTEPVNKACRTDKWISQFLTILDVDNTSYIPANLNMRKARFCCPIVDGGLTSHTALKVHSGNFPTDYDRSQLFRRDFRAVSASDARPVDDLAPAGGDMPYTAEIVAFALISHGKNQKGAFIRGGGQKLMTGGWSGTDESMNAGQAYPYAVAVRPLYTNSAGGLGYFDDVVVFRTNRQLMAAFGTNSCARP